MTSELRITAQGEKLIVETKNGRREFANRIGLRDGKQVVSIGKTAKEIAAADPDHPLPAGVEFIPVLDARAFNREAAAAAVDYLAKQSGAKSRFLPWLNPPELALDFPGYDSLPDKTRALFEADVQFLVGPSRFQINGQTVGTPAARVMAAKASFRLITYAWGAAVLLCVVLSYVPDLLGIHLTAGGAIVLGFVIILIGPIPVELAWLALARRWLPASLARIIFFSGAVGGNILGKQIAALADRLLADQQT